jgi:hypothetical protein
VLRSGEVDARAVAVLEYDPVNHIGNDAHHSNLAAGNVR